MDIRIRRGGRGEDPARVADIAGLLAFAWRQPGPVFAQGLADGTWVGELTELLRGLAGKRLDVAEFREASVVLGTWADGKNADQIEEELAAEYAALYQGPASPLVAFYECQWLDDRSAMLFSAPSTQLVEQAYRTAGLEIATREPADSFVAELEFVWHLATEQNSQVEAGSKPLADRASSLRRAFVRDHLDRWLEDFCGATQGATECAGYAALSRITVAVNKTRLLAG